MEKRVFKTEEIKVDNFELISKLDVMGMVNPGYSFNDILDDKE